MTISGSSVLIIDDDENIGEVLSDIFREKGCTVIVVRNGLEALTKAKETSFDISLIDLELPDINGIGILKKLKKDNPEKLYYIITGYASLQTAISALNDGANGYFLKPIIIEDLMHHIQGEIEKRVLIDKLEESEENFQEAYQRVNFYKDLFTHDINNVLNNVSMALKLLSENVEIVENISDYLNIAREAINRGKNLVNNVRKLSQIDSNEISVVPIGAIKVLKKTIEFVKQTYATKKINVRLEIIKTPFMIYSNEFLTDIFENILINAVEHNLNPEIDIIIQVSKEKRNKVNFIKFEFIDNGIGILNERKINIFKGGYRGDQDREIKGMGFGLSLVKKILSSYGGYINVENRVKGDYSKGSNFIILIPEAE
jgi:signal transduction histidine kinase